MQNIYNMKPCAKRISYITQPLRHRQRHTNRETQRQRETDLETVSDTEKPSKALLHRELESDTLSEHTQPDTLTDDTEKDTESFRIRHR